MNHEARTHFPEEIERIDFANTKPASPADFNRCNTCRYTFKKRGDGVSIDMNDFHRHKATCGRNHN